MDNSIKMIYWSLGAVMFVIAISILFHIDGLMEKEYRYIQYNDRYNEVITNMED